jgi:hypothetical protein
VFCIALLLGDFGWVLLVAGFRFIVYLLVELWGRNVRWRKRVEMDLN